MTGNTFSHPESRLFTDYLLDIFGQTLENQLWFHLKIASFEHIVPQDQQIFGDDTYAGYKPYKLEQLKNYILYDLGKSHFSGGAVNENLAVLEYAKILFLCGEY